jgi:hypothetical protein
LSNNKSHIGGLHKSLYYGDFGCKYLQPGGSKGSLKRLENYALKYLWLCRSLKYHFLVTDSFLEPFTIGRFESRHSSDHSVGQLSNPANKSLYAHSQLDFMMYTLDSVTLEYKYFAKSFVPLRAAQYD